MATTETHDARVQQMLQQILARMDAQGRKLDDMVSSLAATTSRLLGVAADSTAISTATNKISVVANAAPSADATLTDQAPTRCSTMCPDHSIDMPLSDCTTAVAPTSSSTIATLEIGNTFIANTVLVKSTECSMECEKQAVDTDHHVAAAGIGTVASTNCLMECPRLVASDSGVTNLIIVASVTRIMVLEVSYAITNIIPDTLVDVLPGYAVTRSGQDTLLFTGQSDELTCVRLLCLPDGYKVLHLLAPTEVLRFCGVLPRIKKPLNCLRNGLSFGGNSHASVRYALQPPWPPPMEWRIIGSGAAEQRATWLPFRCYGGGLHLISPWPPPLGSVAIFQFLFGNGGQYADSNDYLKASGKIKWVIFNSLEGTPDGLDTVLDQCLDVLLVVFTLTLIAGCIVFLFGQNEFREEATRTLDFVVNQSDFTIQTPRNVTDYLSVATTITVAALYHISDVQGQIDNLKGDLNKAADTIPQKTTENYKMTRKVLHSLSAASICIVVLMRVLAFLGYVLELYGPRYTIYVFATLCWKIVAVLFVLIGIFLLVNSATKDNCQAMDEWPQRFEKTPYLIDGFQVGVYGKPGDEDFEVDYTHWKWVVRNSNVNGLRSDWSIVRNDIKMGCNDQRTCCSSALFKDHVGCIRNRGDDLNCCPEGSWLRSGDCSEIFQHLQGLLGRSIPTSVAGLSFAILRSGGAHDRGEDDEEAMAEQHGKLCVAFDVLHECFVTLTEPRTQSDLIADIVFNRESELRRLNFQGLYMIGHSIVGAAPLFRRGGGSVTRLRKEMVQTRQGTHRPPLCYEP